ERVTLARPEQRPGCCDVPCRLRLKDPREIEHVATPVRLNPQPDRQFVSRVSLEHRCRDAPQCLTRQLLEPFRQAFRRELREILGDAHHATAPEAIFRSLRSVNQGRRLIRAGARWPYTSSPWPGFISRNTFAGAIFR